jgi:hypothetical protein
MRLLSVLLPVEQHSFYWIDGFHSEETLGHRVHSNRIRPTRTSRLWSHGDADRGRRGQNSWKDAMGLVGGRQY